LFIVHGIGGNIVNFYSLSMRMGRDQPVFGVQAQALEVGKPALLHLPDMAAHYLEEIRQVQPEGPYYLLGYSFGGTMVLEMAHQLRAAGQEVALVGMLDSKSRDYLAELSKTVSMQSKINRRVGQFAGNTSRLSLRERVSYTVGKIKTRAIRYSVWAAAACNLKKVPAFMKSATDINYVAAQNYRLSPFDGCVTLFRATEQDDPHAPQDLGWNAIFSRGVDVRELPGDHERIFLEPGIDVLVESLRDALRAAHAAQFARRVPPPGSQNGNHP
jgi:thioesterase domain-containing protein